MLWFNGFFQDGVKAVIYLIPLIYLSIRKSFLELRYFQLLFIGLFLLFFGHLLDFFDEVKCLTHILIIGKKCPLHDFFEDIIGFTFGFIVFILGVFLELHSRKKVKSIRD